MAGETKTSHPVCPADEEDRLGLLCPCETCWVGDRLALDTVVRADYKRHNTNLGKCFSLMCLLMFFSMSGGEDIKAAGYLCLACLLQLVL